MVVVVGLAVLPGVLPHVDVDDGGDVVGHPQAVHAEVGGGLQGEDVALPVEGAVEEHFHLDYLIRFTVGRLCIILWTIRIFALFLIRIRFNGKFMLELICLNAKKV